VKRRNYEPEEYTMGVTSSGLLDEERDAEEDSTTETYPPETMSESGEVNAQATALIGSNVGGSVVEQGNDLKTGQIWLSGPCIYTLP